MNPYMRTMMPVLLLTAIFTLFACDTGTESAEPGEALDTAVVADNAAVHIAVSQPWIRATAPGQTVTGAFMTLTNDSDTPYALMSVSFSGEATVEIHETSMDEGMMRMRRVSQIDIPANGSAELKPGSFHIMLIGLEKAMKTGATETLTLTFSDNSQKSIEATVGAPGE